ncbi:MAG: flippase activity-associated protein Agl23 [Haloferacaceae archaeon]
MSTDDGTGVRPAGSSATLAAVLAVTAVSLLARLVALGGRIFHWDEGRVGYWILRYHETGVYSYRPIIHGPFLAIVNDKIFSVVPPTDFSARLAVAVVGGLLPLVAWLLRDRLRDREVVAVALVLAANPLLVYYSRFMRSDVLVGAFSLFALGFAVRAFDADDPRYLYPAAATFALGFASKENALIYLACFVGGAALLVDHRLLRATSEGVGLRNAVLGGWPLGAVRRVDRWGGWARTVGHLVGSLAVFFAVVVFFYAPRPDFWQAFADPTRLPAVVEAGTAGAWKEFYSTWGGGHHQNHSYLPYLHDFLQSFVYGAPAVIVFALVGFVADGYASERSREVVAFAFYVGVVSVVGYPIATDIQAPWAVVHAVVPLSIPAGVGLAYIFGSGRKAFARDDVVGAGLAAVLLLSAVTGVVGANASYMNSTDEQDKMVLQWAQPGNDLKGTLEKVHAVSEENQQGTDVLFYGTYNPYSHDTLFYVANESSARQPPVGGPSWHSRLPLPWYLERYGAEVNSTAPATPPETIRERNPPVVIAYAWNRSDLEPVLDGYAVYEHRFKLWNENVTVFIDREALRRAGYEADARAKAESA